MKKLLFAATTVLCFIATTPLLAQTFHGGSCPSDSRTDSLVAADPRYARSLFHLEQAFRHRQNTPTEERSDEIHTIPVVVHILHEGESYGQGSNITDEQIASAITALNQDFRRMVGTNGFGAGADVRIEFCLASRSPQGNPTTGIVRVNGSSIAGYADGGLSLFNTTGAQEAAVKALSTWPREQYMNIWVVNEIDNNDAGSGIQGFAYFPFNSPLDGVTVLFNAFGTVGNLKSFTDMGRVLTHEVGHFLGLYHTFHETSTCSEADCVFNGDRVCDTPATTLQSNCSTPACTNQQVENYMDYTAETCQDMFTEGQKLRMRTTLETQRTSLLTSMGCMPVFGLDAGITAILSPGGTSCATSYQPQVTLSNFGSTTLTSAVIHYSVDGSNAQVFNWSGSLAAGSATTLTLPTLTTTIGTHTLFVWTGLLNGTTDQNASNNQATRNFTVANGATINLTVVLDFYGLETSWAITDASGQVMDFGGPYVNNQQGLNISESSCLPTGCYTLTFTDSYGDGQGFTNGSYTLRDQNNQVLATASGNWGATSADDFCVTATAPVGTAPTAAFTVSDATICAATGVNFTNTTTGSPTSYSWSFPGASTTSSTQASPQNIVYPTAGTYSVTLTATNASGSNTYTCTNCITVITGPTVALTPTHPSCFGGANGSIASTVTGGFSPYTYLWSNGSTAAQPTGLTAGTYSAVVTNNQGCTRQSTVVLTAPTQMSISANTIAPSCNGANDGSITVTATGGTGSKTFVWNTGATTATLSGLDGGTYTVTATDANGCTRTQNYTLTEPQALQASVTPTQIGCGATTGGASVAVSGGTAPYTYDWSTGSTAPTVSGLLAGNYSITTSDANGCSVENNFAIATGSGLTVALAGTNILCRGTATGAIDVTVTGGTLPYTYSWSHGNTQGDQNNITAGFYSVTVTDAAGCMGSGNITLTQPAVLNVAVFKTDISCFGLADGSATATATGGVSPYTYTWSNGQQGAAVSNLASGNYSVTASDANGCFTGESILIVQPSLLTLSTMVLQPESCDGNDGAAVVNTMGGTGNNSISWSNGNTSTTLENVSAGVYGVTVEDSNGCSLEGSVEVPYECTIVVPTTQLIAQDCQATALALNSVISCEQVAGAEMYEWRFTTPAGAILAQELSLGNQFMLSQAPSIVPGSTIRIAIRVMVSSTWGAYGDACTVELAAVDVTTELTAESCGMVFNTMDQNIYATPIAEAINYEWRFEGVNTDYDWTAYTTEALLTLSSTMLFEYGETYTVTVRCAMGAGVFTPWGDACSIGFEELIGLNELGGTAGGILLYPNPNFGHEIHLQFSNTDARPTEQTFDIYSANGSWIDHIQMNIGPGSTENKVHQFDQPLAAGFYVVKYQHNGQLLEERFVVR